MLSLPEPASSVTRIDDMALANSWSLADDRAYTSPKETRGLQMEQTSGSTPSFELAVTPANARFDPNDERWLEQVSEFIVQARRELPGTELRSVPVRGTKGAAAELIIALGTSGAFETALAFFRGWLGRDKDRGLVLKWDAEGHRGDLSISGTHVPESAFDELADAIATRLRS